MQFRRRQRADIAIDMTPMIDCVFQLLIFFLLTASFLSPTVQLRLPQASADRARPPDELVVVSVDAASQVFLNREAVSLEALPGRLQALAGQARSLPVVLKADRALAYDKVLQVLLAVQKAGCTHVHLAYEEKN